MHKFARLSLSAVMVLGLGGMLAGRVHAAYVFANVNNPSGNPIFSFTNNGGTSATIGVSNAPVTFNFTAPTGQGTGVRAAFLNVAPVVPPSTTVPVSASNLLLDQQINQLERLSITSGSGGTGTNFLTLFFTGDLTGISGSNQGSVVGSDNNPSAPRVVAYTSDFGTFTQPGSAYNLALSNISPALSIGPGGFLNSFGSDIGGAFTGNFLANPQAVPEPSSVVIAATGGLLLAGCSWRKRRHATIAADRARPRTL